MEDVYDCVVVGAGPGGIQASIYLARYNLRVLILDRSGGRTRMARHIENYLGFRAVSGADLLELGLEQAKSFGVEVEKAKVEKLNRDDDVFILDSSDGRKFFAETVIASSGVIDKFPGIDGLYRFLGKGYYTCIDCDGYRTRNRNLLVLGNHINTARLALAMRRLYTRNVSLLLLAYDPPPDYKEELEKKKIPLYKGRPVKLLGEESIIGMELQGGTRIMCDAVMQNFGYSLQDGYLQGLELERDAHGFKYRVNASFESSLSGLYIVGPLNTGNDQVVIAAGEGATAAIDIKKRLLSF